MYSSLYVPLDNSEHSNACVEVATALAAAMGARCTGSHVYAARMHDYRFKQMEYTLPEEYQDETELLRQRRIHDSLITTGLQLISDSYTDVMRYRCLERGVAFASRMIDGRNWEALVADIGETDCDLVVMGALGMGAVKESLLGSVTERVMRRVRKDLLILRRTGDAAMDGHIVVAVDGSPQSFGGLRTALDLAAVLGKRVEAVAVYDPYLHYAVFNSIVDVLSEKASKVFRFKEQEALHEEIIDTGLAKIYSSHLEVARATAGEAGVDLDVTLLDGKAFERVLRYVREVDPWLLVCGRIGVHSDQGMDIGGNAEQLARLAPCNLLLGARTHVPPIDVRADAAVSWTPEAEGRLERVPAGARGIARTAVLRWATERGHSVVSSGDVETALDELMPFARVTRRLAQVGRTLDEAERALVDEAPVEGARAICTTCGYAARAERPVTCPVCGGSPDGFEPVDAAAMLAAAEAEGDASETAFDGRKLGWTLDARQLLHQLPAGYLRRRVKAIVEKAARTRRLPAITRESVEPHVLPELEALDGRAGAHRAPLPRPVDGDTAGIGDDGLVPAGSSGDVTRRLPWTAAAESRLDRVPQGFLRNLAREQVERIAIAVAAPAVEVLHVEAGLAEVRSRMQAVRREEGAAAAPGPSGGGCPVHRPEPRAAAAPMMPPVPTPGATPAPGCPVGHSLDAHAELTDRSHELSAAPPRHTAAADEPAQLRGLNEVTADLVESLGKKRGYRARP